MAKFVYVITFGPDSEKRLATRPEHREYLAGLLAAGKLHESGPFLDDTGALLIYEAESEEEARRLIADDPYTRAGVVATSMLKEWNRVYAAG